MTIETLKRNSILSTNRAGYYRINPVQYQVSDPNNSDWTYFNSYNEALNQLQFDPIDLLPFIDTSGFYHKEMKVRAGLFVYGPGYTLLKDDKDTYTYPVSGWEWFDSAQDAVTKLDLDLKDFNLDLY